MPEGYKVHVDTALSDFAVSYFMEPNAFVARRAFPAVAVPKQSDKYWVYDRADLLRPEAKKRAPGTRAPLRDFGAATASYFANVWAVAKAISEQDSVNADPGLNLEESTVKALIQDLQIQEEVQFAAVAFAASWGTNTTPSPTWESASAYPLKDLATGIRTIQRNTGRTPNKLVLGAETWYSGLLLHPDIIERLPDNAPRIITPGFLSNLLGLSEVLIATAGYNTKIEGLTASYSSVLGDGALLLYSDPNPGLGTATGGATFVWSGLEGSQSGLRVQREFMPVDDAMPLITAENAFVHKIVATPLGYYLSACIT